MKLHDLRPAPGSHTARTRVGRGIAAGKGKTAGRGTKGQKARAGGSIPPWFEGGQTPLHMRIPKLRGFKNRFKVEYEVVNVGAIAAAAERGAFEGGEHAEATGSKSKKSAPVTVNQDILRAVGLVRTLSKPLKILGSGEIETPLFVVADAFTKSAAAKIEAAGGTVSVLEVPTEARPAIGVGEDGGKPARQPRTAAGRAAASREADAKDARVADAAERAEAVTAATEAREARAAGSGRKAKAERAPKAEAVAEAGEAADEAAETPAAATAEPEASAEPTPAEPPADEAGEAGRPRSDEAPAEAPAEASGAGTSADGESA
ncbi:MAG TPA: 50S ribosomal protein L15 [Candidatus Limnocylindrales bacterium]|nr:50S ribosomal protein L15 [Candidatus Limnocylindrales bacterium]